MEEKRAMTDGPLAFSHRVWNDRAEKDGVIFCKNMQKSMENFARRCHSYWKNLAGMRASHWAQSSMPRGGVVYWHINHWGRGGG